MKTYLFFLQVRHLKQVEEMVQVIIRYIPAGTIAIKNVADLYLVSKYGGNY